MQMWYLLHFCFSLVTLVNPFFRPVLDLQSFDSSAKTCVGVVFSETKFLSVSVRNSSNNLSTSATSLLRPGPISVKKEFPCIRLARGKFELTNQDSAGGKNSVSSRQCKLTGKALKSSNFSH